MVYSTKKISKAKYRAREYSEPTTMPENQYDIELRNEKKTTKKM